MRDLVVCSLEMWDDVWRRNQFLVAGLLDAEPALRVLYVEPCADPTFELSMRRRPRRGRGLRDQPAVAAGRLYTYQQTKPAPRQLGTWVDAALTAQLLRAARRLGLRDPILWINDPSRAPLVRRTGWPCLYDITDDWVAAERPGRVQARTRANEDELMRRCDAVVVCSRRLAEVKGAVRPVHLVPNAVDLARYRRPTERPDDVPSGPVALYAGTLHEDRLDVDLCLAVARELGSAGTLVLLGPNALSTENTARLASATNVRLLGARPYAQVAAYLQYADALLVPHVVTEFTESLDPIKLYEYLAVGRPIVATPVAGFRDLPELVTVAGAADFPAAVQRALNDRRAGSARRPVGELPTWAERVEQVREILAAIG